MKLKTIKMSSLLILLFNLSMIFNGYSCSGSTSEGDRVNNDLPDSRPQKLLITYYDGGGMVYYSEQLHISEDSCVYTINDAGTISKVYFSMTPVELDELYKVFTDNDFSSIKTYEEKVYDRGGESISLSWGQGKSANILNGGITFIKDGWKKEWNNCIAAIEAALAKGTEKQKKDYEVRVDKTLFGKTMSVYIRQLQIIPQSTVMSESGMDNNISRTTKLLPGNYKMSVSYNSKYEVIPVSPDSSKGVELSLKNDSLIYSYIK
jgi:hypothetical protein